MARLPALVGRIAAHRRAVLSASFALGVLAAMGQAPFGLFPATVAGIFAGYALVRAAPTPRRAALAGWGLGAGYFAFTLIWIVQPFMVDAARDGWMAPFALVFMAGGLALFWAGASGFARWLAPGRYGWLGWAAAMSAAELLRGILFTGFPWGGPGAVWVDTPFLQLAAFIGADGLGFLTFLLAAGIRASLSARSKVAAGTLVLAVFAAASFAGYWRGTGQTAPRETPVMLRIVQPNAAQHLKWDPRYRELFVDRQIDMTALPPEPGAAAPDLVIWPETAVPYLLDISDQLLEEVSENAGSAQVVLGIQRREGTRFFNSMAVLGQGGQVGAVYDKHHLVPFGEYVPLGGLLDQIGIHGFAAQHGFGYSPGPGAAILDLGKAGKVLPLICYEAIFSRDLRAAPGRADWILQITNDAWFGTFSGPQQHLAQAQLRAVEQGLSFVRAANTGISAVIDPRGRIVAHLDLGVSGKLDAALPASLGPTFYARFGDATLILALILVFTALFAVRGRISN